MKKISLLVSAIVCALLLASCNMISNVGYVTGEKGKSTLTLSVASFVPSSRTVLPNDWTDPRKADLTYKLTGSRTQGGANEITASNIFTYDQLSGAAGAAPAIIELEPVVWYLVLTAYQGENAVLVSAETIVNLTGGSSSQSFTLAAVGETDATGDVEFSVTFPKPERFGSVIYGLYTTGDINATEPVAGSQLYTKAADEVTVVNVSQNKYKVSYSASGIKAAKTGIYLQARFMNDANQCIGFYSEAVWVDGGNLSSKNIVLDENFFNTDPDPVSNLTISYAYNSNGTDASVFEWLQDVPDVYDVTFNWSDNSNNETKFELTVSNGTITGTRTFDIPASSTSYTISSIGDPDGYDFVTGNVYTAKLRAVNGFSKDSADDDANFVSLNDICLFTVTYDLAGGNVKISEQNDTADAVDPVNVYVDPYVKSDSAITLMTGSSDFPYVYKDGYTFVRWDYDDDGDYTTAPVALSQIAADNVDNVIVEAVWSSPLGISATFPSYSGFDTRLVSGDGGTLVVNGNSEGANVVLTKAAVASDVTFTVYDTDYVTVLYTTTDADGFNWVLTDSTASPAVLVPAGTYRVYVTGTVNGGSVDDNFYIMVTR